MVNGRDRDSTSGTTEGNSSSVDFKAPNRRILSVDVAKYQSYLNETGLDAPEQAEVLKALWSIIVTFIDLGFEIHPVQEACAEKHEVSIQGPIEVIDSATPANAPKVEAAACQRLLNRVEIE